MSYRELDFAMWINDLGDAINLMTINEEAVAQEIAEGIFRGTDDPAPGGYRGPIHPTLRQGMGRVLKALLQEVDAHYQKFPPDGRDEATAAYIHKLNEAGKDAYLPFV